VKGAGRKSMKSDKQSVNEIMKMDVENREQVGQKNAVSPLDKVENDFVYIDEVKFPIVAEMPKATLLIVDSITSYNVTGNTIIFQTKGVFFRKRYFYRFFDFRPTFDKIEKYRNICVGLTVCDEDIIRLRACQGHHLPEHKTEMVINDFNKGCRFDVIEQEKEFIIRTAKLAVVITKHPWNLQIYDKEGRRIFRQFGEEKRTHMQFENCSFGFLFDTESGERYAGESILFDDDEHFYGFGEKFHPIDKKGQNINLWNTNALGTNSVRTYKNIPFFVSTAGYGMFINTSYKINCNMGAQLYKAYSILTGDSVIDNYIIYGPQIKKIIKRYTDITGNPQVPPKWSFGFWISKISYETRNEVENLADRLRKEDIPCDVIHIDTNWFDENWVCDYKFSDNKFPNAAEMIRNLGKKGFHVSLWQMPYIDRGEHMNPVYEEGMQKGYFAFREDGSEDFRHGLIDFSNPDAVKWYQEELLTPLLEMGVAAIKVDFGESAPFFYKYDGYDGKEMHNLYPLLYNKAVYEVTRNVRGKDEGVIWARSTWAGSQRYPLHWGGDCGTDFAAMVSQLKSGLSMGLSGFPFWSHDVGGFHHETNPELYIRWMQMGVFSSHIRTHGFYTREPWDFGEKALVICRRYLKLRYKLLPYIYSQAHTCVKNSLPMMRALVIDYQEDENVHAIDNQYLFGDYFLVAPVMHSKNSRKLYLPSGVWTEYWSKEKHSGGRWITVDAPLDVLPLFVKENAIIPMGPELNYVDEITDYPLEFDLYPVDKGHSEFEFVDKQTYFTVSMYVSEEAVSVSVPARKQNVLLQFNNPGVVSEIVMNEKVVEKEPPGRRIKVPVSASNTDVLVVVKRKPQPAY
jgi:alpha-D-xyloside xylohydrolase